MSLKKQIDQSDELYEILRNNCVDGLPTMNTSMFSQMTEKYGKDVFRRTLANYIEKEKPPFPVKIFNKEKGIKKIHGLKKHDWKNWRSKRD